jgi:hypothetical protein
MSALRLFILWRPKDVQVFQHGFKGSDYPIKI